MFHSTIPQPYLEAWDIIRRDRYRDIPRLMHEGITVRIQVQEAPPPGVDPMSLETVTVREYWVRMSVAQVLDRVCGIVDTMELRLIEERFRGYALRRERQLCPEYRQAYAQMVEITERNRLVSFIYEGIPVRDSMWPEPRSIAVSPGEVFAAMRVCGVQIEHPHLQEFYGFVMRTEREQNWDRTNTWTIPRVGAYAPAPLSIQNLQEEYYRITQAQIDAITAGFNVFGYSNQSLSEAKASSERGLALIKRVVTAEEFQCFQEKHYIDVTGKKFRYRIKKAGQTVLFHLGSETASETACLQLTAHNAPQEDRVVMEYLMIRNDESRYLKEANRFRAPAPMFQVQPADRLACSILRSFGGLGGSIANIIAPGS